MMRKHNILALLLIIAIFIPAIPAFAYGEAMISGRITLDKPAQYDGYIPLCFAPVDVRGSYASVEVPVKKGDTSASYSVNADRNIYTISSQTNWPSFVALTYSVTDDWQRKDDDERCYIDLRWGDKQNFDLNYSSENIHPEETEDGAPIERETVPVTVTMPSGIPKDKDISVSFVEPEHIYENGMSYTRAADFDFPAGVTTATENAIKQDNDFYVMIEADWERFIKTYFYSEEYGLTSDKDKATLFSASAQSINLDLSNAFSSISGTVSRNGVKVGEKLDFSVRVYAKYEQDDLEEGIYMGQNFYDIPLCINADEENTDYYILVPRELNGDAMIFIDYCREGKDSPHDDITISGNVTHNLSFTDEYRKITGTITLTSSAPEGGVTVDVSQNYNSHVTCSIPEGEKSVNYTYYALNDNDEISFRTNCDDMRFEQWASAEIDAQTATCDVEIIMYTKNITGTVSVPQGMAMKNAVSYKIAAVAYDEEENAVDSFEQYGTIFKDGAEGRYSIDLPDNTVATDVSLEITAEGGMELITTEGATDKDFVLTSEVGVSDISAEYDNETGQITVSYNSDGKADYTVQAIAAVYDENNILIYVHPEQLTFDKDSVPVSFAAEIGDKLTEGNTARLLVWKSFKSLVPVTSNTIAINSSSSP